MNTEEDFKREFRELLRKYNVDMSIENDRDGYSEVNFFRYETFEWDEDYRDMKIVSEMINWNTRGENGEE